jgi:hypothetical protein
MNIYRLDPVGPEHPSWSNSTENETVWACAPTARDARDLVAKKTASGVQGVTGSRSPWLDEAITSCVWEPSMTHIRAETVVRADGSTVGG